METETEERPSFSRTKSVSTFGQIESKNNENDNE